MTRQSYRASAGFALIEMILIGVVIVAILFVGWRLVAKKNSLDKMATTNGPTTSVAGLHINTSSLAYDNPPQPNPNPDPNGPYYHSIYEATSTDGLNFNPTGVQIINHASVPDMIRLSSGQIVFYAVDASGRSNSGVLVGVSSDNGKSWKFGSMELESSRQPAVAADPQITIDNQGQLRLFYTVWPNGPQTPGQTQNANSSPNNIDSATSTDGIHFIEDPGVRLAHAQITDPDPVKINNTWFLYVSEGPTLAYATSTDGLHFIYQGIIRQQGSVSKTIPIGNGQWRQYYCVNNGIGSATSTNGINWTTDNGLRLSTPPGKFICDPTVAQISQNNWLMIYKVTHAQ